MKRFEEIPLLSGGNYAGHLGEIQKNRLNFFHRFNDELGDVCRLRVFNYRMLFVNTPELVHEVLVEKAKCFEKSPILRTVLHPIAGEGIFTAEGELWKRQRRLMSPLFQHSQLEGYANAMAACTEQVVSGLADGEAVDIARVTTRITMNVAGRTLFDADTLTEADELGNALATALHWVDWAVSSVPLILQTRVRTWLDHLKPFASPSLDELRKRAVHGLLAPVHWPSERSRTLAKAIQVLDAKVERMIRDRRAQGLSRPDLLSRLLAAHDDDGTRMSDRQVRDEVLTLFIAGHETTASGLAWALYLLGRHPEAYARVRAEADALSGPPTYADLPRLGYSLKVFKEALRLYPPVFFFGRQTVCDVEVGGYLIPPRIVVMVSPYALHHRKDTWPDPEKFDPERFTPEREEGRHRQAFIPFSAGPRTCIGNHFALMEGPMVLATMLRHMDLSLANDEPVVPEPKTTLRPRGGVPMRVKLRH